MLRRDASKEELLVPSPDKEREMDLGPQHRLPSAPIAIGKYVDHRGHLIPVPFHSVLGSGFGSPSGSGSLERGSESQHALY